MYHDVPPCTCRVSSNMSTHRELLKLMKVPIDSFDNPLTILQLSHVSSVHEMFDYAGRKTLACHLVQAIVNKVAYITSADEVWHVQVYNMWLMSWWVCTCRWNLSFSCSLRWSRINQISPLGR